MLADIACVTAFDAAEYFGPVKLVGVLEFFWDVWATRATAHDHAAVLIDDGLDMQADLIALVLDSLFFGTVLL